LTLNPQKVERAIAAAAAAARPEEGTELSPARRWVGKALEGPPARIASCCGAHVKELSLLPFF
jgi:hypothetical protein